MLTINEKYGGDKRILKYIEDNGYSINDIIEDSKIYRVKVEINDNDELYYTVESDKINKTNYDYYSYSVCAIDKDCIYNESVLGSKDSYLRSIYTIIGDSEYHKKLAKKISIRIYEEAKERHLKALREVKHCKNIVDRSLNFKESI